MAKPVIWITGASSGIGEAAARKFSTEGFALILSARNTQELERVKNSCAFPEDCRILPLDLASSADFPEKVATAISFFGQVDMVLHNGGISQRSLIKDTLLEVDRRLMEVNYFGTVALTKAILPHFLARKKGQFGVITSLVGKFGTPYRSSYAGSKHALHGFYESLYLENMKFGINITMVCPGSVKTNIAKNALLKDGSASNSSENRLEQGMNPNLCAKKIIVAVSKNKKEVIIGGKEILPVYIKRFLPSFFWWIIQRVKP